MSQIFTRRQQSDVEQWLHRRREMKLAIMHWKKNVAYQLKELGLSVGTERDDPATRKAAILSEPNGEILKYIQWLEVIEAVQSKIQGTDMARLFDVWYGRRDRPVYFALDSLHIDMRTLYRWRKEIAICALMYAIQKGLMKY